MPALGTNITFILQDFTGGMAVLFMAANCYLADISDVENRTRRLSYFYGVYPVGANIGKALSGVVKTRLGLMYNFAVGLLLTAAAVLYLGLFVTDSTEIVKQKMIADGKKIGNYLC